MCDPACEFSEMRLLAAPSSERITRLGGLGPRRVAGMRGAPGKGVSLGAGPPVITDAGPTSDPAERWGPLVATCLVRGVKLPGAPHRGLTIMVATSEPSLCPGEWGGEVAGARPRVRPEGAHAGAALRPPVVGHMPSRVVWGLHGRWKATGALGPGKEEDGRHFRLPYVAAATTARLDPSNRSLGQLL